MDNTLQITSHTEDGLHRLTVRGDLTIYGAIEMKTRLLEALERPVGAERAERITRRMGGRR